MGVSMTHQRLLLMSIKLRMMNRHWVGYFLCIVLLFNYVDGTFDKQAHTNANQIESGWLTLEESVMRDVLELKESFNKIHEDINQAFGEFRAFTEGSIEDLSKQIVAELGKSDKVLESSTEKLEVYTKRKVVEMNKTLLENLQTLSSTMAEERKSIVDWANERSSIHENLLKTDVTLCAYDEEQSSRKRVVRYNGRHSGFLNDQKSWQVFNESRNQESCAMEVLNRHTGRFTVPQNADGLYLFTFSITMDTWDFIEGHAWDFYYFRKNGHKILGSELYGDAGSNEDHDKLPGSRTILLELNAGDFVDVFQKKKRDIPDRQASFCGSLIHLRKAPEGPGGWAVGSGHESFPIIKPDFEPKIVTFAEKTFEDVPDATFTHTTDINTPAERTLVEKEWLDEWKLQSDDTDAFIIKVRDDIDYGL